MEREEPIVARLDGNAASAFIQPCVSSYWLFSPAPLAS